MERTERNETCWLPQSRVWLAVGIVLLAIALPATAQALDPQRPLSQALLRIWQSQQGLPRAAIFALRQSHDGYLWLGTQAGLYRFDGMRFVEITGGPKRPLDKLWIHDLCEDRDGNLWVATDDAGLLCLREGLVTFVGPEQGLPAEHIYCLEVDDTGVLWAGTDRGLACLRRDKWEIYDSSHGLPGNDIRALALGANGAMGVASGEHHVGYWDGNTYQPVEFAEPLRGTVRALGIDSDNTLWVGTSAGLLRRTEKEEKYLTPPDVSELGSVYCLTIASSGGLWAGTSDGFYRIQGERVEPFQTRDGLSQSTVFALCEDHEGSLWAGTKHGLNQLVDRRTLLPFTTSEGLPSNDTGPVLQDEAGNIWVGTRGAGLARFDGREFQTVATASSGLPSNIVLSLAAGDDGQLWIGTAQGLCRWKNGEIVKRFTTEDGLPANMVRCLRVDTAGVLWAGTTAGVAEFREGRFVPPAGDSTLQRQAVQALIDYRGQYLIVATVGGGLYKVADHKLSALSNELPVAHEVNALYLDQQHRLWLAIRGQGLGMFAGEKFVQYRVKDGLYDDDIFGITDDGKGQLWMACSRGIFSVSLGELERFANGATTRVASTPFSPTDAQRTIECQSGVQPGVWKMRDGRIWFSTIRGIIVVDPERTSRKLPKPAVVVEEVRVNGEKMSRQELAHLPPGRSNVDFQYTALSLASPGRITFRYKLAGFDNDWIEAGLRREAFYTNLSPGSYRFHVQAINSDGLVHEAMTPVALTIAPYFYQTKWFFPLLVLGIVSGGWLVYRIRLGQVKGRLQAVLAERSRIARELHDTLIQGFSGVTMQMQALTTRLPASPERATLTGIIEDASGCLSEARRSVAGLRNPTGEESSLATAIAQAARQLTETSDTQLRLRLETMVSEFKPDVEYNILRIVQEATTNALKHSGASIIDVSMQADKQSLVITVRDDGSGFEVAQYLEQVQPGHYGLVGMRERATQIGAIIDWRSELRRGTTVTLRCPLSKRALAATSNTASDSLS